MIHYHGTPVGGKREDSVKFLSGRHALISFAAPEDLPVAAEQAAKHLEPTGNQHP